MRRGKLELVRTHPQRAHEQGQSSRKRRQRQQVAAICFRILSSGVEFLLVRTRRGRWTFPKGGVQSGLTHAQSAALEAFEEAGVHGRIEAIAFLRYTLRKFTAENCEPETQSSVHAHLCEVLRLGSPQEPGRDPTWFSSAKAKRRLAEGRTSENAAELARAIDRAVARIRRLPARTAMTKDHLLTVKFEASEIDMHRLSMQASSIRSFGDEDEKGLLASEKVVFRHPRAKVLQLGTSQPRRPAP
jgi:8-oxo-dGTP pyrophosphatase MutT (NUDIX family)